MLLYTNFLWGHSGKSMSMLVEGGRVRARSAGPMEVPGATRIDLEGRYLLPSFVDAHCHVLPAGLDLLSSTLDGLNEKEEALDLIRDAHVAKPDGWLHVVQYDHNRFGEHITRDELDRIAAGRPVLVEHANGHSSVANSAALIAAKVDESTADPEGGSYDRDAGGRMTGLLLELAHEHVLAAMPKPTQDEMVEAILRAGRSMRALGISCASDMMTGFFDLETELEAYRIAAERGCEISVRLYLQWKTVFGPRGIGLERLRAIDLGPSDRLKVAGIKLFSDGAISSATAAIYGTYSGETANGPRISRRGHAPVAADGRPTSGQLIYKPERLKDMVATASDAGYSVSIHAIGDYAVDLTLDAFEATGDASRHRIEHAMILSSEQIERLARTQVETTFQPEFLLRLGQAYQRQLGAERAHGILPFRSALDTGVRLSFSSDRPIVGGNPWDGILTAEHRPEGFAAEQNISRTEGVRLYSGASSRANGDGDGFGTLEPGAEASFCLYETDPMATPRPVVFRSVLADGRETSGTAD